MRAVHSAVGLGPQWNVRPESTLQGQTIARARLRADQLLGGAQAIERLRANDDALQDRERFMGIHTLLVRLTQVSNDLRLTGRID